ncbi:P1 family peptidase [Ammoniphilus sp. CFH 90114]|uniref:DmpA family aminopeptidase n=1 Tax=Ammoniphilus sp. CFH 90114 TaxID=2493665 RepID=UPI00100E017E|nr:P1 family peptidase [Ammoniphilus sp. CFH 90114]RXT08105.1 S58 family peptidase [Ammoniphilus sp. CFH 90114]
MGTKKRLRDYGISIGQLPTGPKNKITDVQGVKVGHVTLSEGAIQTGVTCILPHRGNCFQDKVLATSYVINGFGKTVGTIQMEELGVLETPILLTNTLSVGTVSAALVEYMLRDNEDIGVTTGTVNPVVGECNDGYLNDIRGLHVQKEHAWDAICKASEDFEEGAVGAGTGMSCFGLKGGIGSASRVVRIEALDYTVGCIVLSNFGQKGDLLIDGRPVGKWIEMQDQSGHMTERDKGSIIIVLATDIPLSERQLKRVSKRATVGLSRTGSFVGHGSGDIVLSFSTANQVPHYPETTEVIQTVLHEDHLDSVFRAVAEAVEESILNSMVTAKSVTGRDGNSRRSLSEYMEAWLLQS